MAGPGMMLAYGEPISGKNNDLYQISECFDNLCLFLLEAGIKQQVYS
jgi:hypothetical protein